MAVCSAAGGKAGVVAICMLVTLRTLFSFNTVPRAPIQPFSPRDLIKTTACIKDAGTETVIGGRVALSE